MGTPFDVAFGRLAVAQGLVAQDAVRALYQQLPPGRTLKDELVARRLLAPERAHALEAWLRQHPHAQRASSGAFQAVTPAPPPDEGLTLRAPPRPAPPPDEGATMRAAPPAPPGDDSATMRAGGSAAQGGASSFSARLPEVGDVIAERYELVGLLGKGGMGAVFKARDRQSGDLFALKVMLSTGDGGALARFEREAQALAKVDAHAGIIRIRGLGEHQGLTYALMDLVVGKDLHKLVKDEGPLEVERALRYTEAVARAVHFCHQRNVLHRDLKPANVLLRGADDTPLVMDFGLALDKDAQRLTKTGEVMGTPAYMSPEQAEGDKAGIDARTDVYALGAILYELVTGNAPFSGTQMEILKKVFLDMPAPIVSVRRQAPELLDVVCARAMAKDKTKRYPTAEAFADDLARLRRGEPIEARPPTWREELAWRWRRKDRRLVTQLVAVLLVALAPPLALGAYHVWRQRGRAEVMAKLTKTLKALGPALDGDPWPLPGSRSATEGVSGHASAIRARLAELQGTAAPEEAPDAHALARLAIWLDGDEPLARELREGLAADAPRARAALVRLARRRSTDAGAAEWPEGAAPAAGTTDPEERLLLALRALAWSRADVTLTAGEARAAREALAALRAEPGVVGGVATVVLERIDPLAAKVGDALDQGAKLLVQQLGTNLSEGAGREVTRPAGWDTAAQVGDERVRAWLDAERAALRLTSAATALRGAHDVLPAEGPLWTRPEPYKVLASFVSTVLAHVGAATPESVAALAPTLSRLVYAAGSRARRSKVSSDAAAAFLHVVTPVVPYLTDLEGDPRAEDGAGECLMSAIIARQQGATDLDALAVPGTEVPGAKIHFDGDTLVAARRLGANPRIAGAGDMAKRLLADFAPVLSRCPVGEAYLVRAQLVEEAEPPRGERAATPDRAALVRVAEDLAAALGDDLSPELRGRLELPPATPLLARLRSFWKAKVLGDLVVAVLRREDGLADDGDASRPSRVVVDACLELVDGLASREAEFPANDYAGTLRHVAHGVSDILQQRQGLDPAWRASLARQELPRWKAAFDAAWRTLERAAKSPPAGGDPTLEDLRNALDVERELRAGFPGPVEGLRKCLQAEGRHPEVAALLADAVQRIEGLGLEPPLFLLLDRAEAEERVGRPDAAAGLASDVRGRADRALPRAIRRSEREALRKQRSRARAIEARVRLAQGDAAAARALLDAARREGDPVDEGFWAGVREQLGR